MQRLLGNCLSAESLDLHFAFQVLYTSQHRPVMRTRGLHRAGQLLSAIVNPTHSYHMLPMLHQKAVFVVHLCCALDQEQLQQQ